jgi:hypothetical protein
MQVAGAGTWLKAPPLQSLCVALKTMWQLLQSPSPAPLAAA